MDTKQQGGDNALVCPGPNIAYFTEIVSLRTMVDHIYGRTNLIKRTDRPHVFVKELRLYVEYLRNQIIESVKPFDTKQRAFFEKFRDNLCSGIEYYRDLFAKTEERWTDVYHDFQKELSAFQRELYSLLPPEAEPVMIRSQAAG
jgi:hypothetical protein